MDWFEPDVEYIIGEIADAYINILEALQQDNLDRAHYWEQHLTDLVRGLERFTKKSL